MNWMTTSGLTRGLDRDAIAQHMPGAPVAQCGLVGTGGIARFAS